MARLRYTQIDDELLACIWGRHNITSHDVVANPPRRTKEPVYGTQVTFLCPRCGTRRADVYDSKGELNNRRYLYSERYIQALESVRLGKVKRQQVTLEVIRRLRRDHRVRQEVKEKADRKRRTNTRNQTGRKRLRVVV